MTHAHFCGMVTHPVMALGKQRDRIYMAAFQGLLELVSVEVGSDAGNVFGRVEVEVDLAKTKDVRTHGSWKASGLTVLRVSPTHKGHSFVSL